MLTALAVDQDPGLNPDAAVWDRPQSVEVTLTAQQLTYPMGGGTVPTIEARALHYQDMLYVRLHWADAQPNDRTVAVEDFADAVALEFPAESAASVPSICMGQADAGVNIWYWRADGEAGPPDLPAEIYPNTLVDFYPSTDDLYYPARAVGNPVATRSAVQNLVARLLF